MVMWTEQDILRALGEWIWEPAGTEVIATEDYRAQFLPDEYGRKASVPVIHSDRPASDLINEVNQLAAERGYPEVVWGIFPTTTPPSLGEELMARGGTIDDEGALLSLHVPHDGILDVGRTDGVEVRRVRDVDGLTYYRRITSTVYNQPMLSESEIAAEAEQIPHDDMGCRFVGYLDGQPAGTGATAIRENGAASLFGAATYPEFRGRGVYRTIMAERVRWAAEKSVPILLASARLATSAPIMQRLGFTQHGSTRSIRVTSLGAHG